MAANLIIKAYCDYTASLFFRDIEVIRPEGVPQTGPTIVYSNHNNQFLDGVVLLLLSSYFTTASPGKFISWQRLHLLGGGSLGIYLNYQMPFPLREPKI
jgi:hypothetical protein